MPFVFALLVIAAIAGPVIAWKAGVAHGSGVGKGQLERFRGILVEEFKTKRNVPHSREIIFAAFNESKLGVMEVYNGPDRLQDVPVVAWPVDQGSE